MAELEQAVKKIDAKLRMLKFTTEEVPRIREKKELKVLKRLQKDLEKQLDGVHEQKCIISLPTIQGSQPAKIHPFYEKLSTNAQALETMGKIQEINGYVRVTLDKLPDIRADLVRLDDNWQEWGFPHMLESLRK
ncbi:unnamed protein product [Pocillopora meandrina]|uniref:Uncharacterized protein n=1 Tax=Pocillopora meandrina TaxID=46732 RepID=A0AAU9VQW6_9CNID|nr:unnamed protein product [Pocillopora meandrina]